jgi:hypothetical protein
MDVILVGYQPGLFRKKHTNFWPWNYLTETFRKLEYQAWHMNVNKIDHSRPHIYICWNEPDTIQLLNKYHIHKDSILVQKLTSFDGSPESAGKEWTDDPLKFFQEWHWPQYQKLDQLNDSGYRFYAFGARTDVDSFPVKKRIADKYKERIFWIPWGTMTVSYEEIMNAKPIMSGFKNDIGFVGSRWGTIYRGNILEWDNYLQPLIDQVQTSIIAGRGTKRGPVSVQEHIEILKTSRLCPIIHATSWKTEKGIMDRFWTVFSLGRFGVIDNIGILDFFNEDEIVLATEKEEYIDKSLYYIKNIEKQKPFIEKILKRIQTEYNQYIVWKNILKQISSDQ